MFVAAYSTDSSSEYNIIVNLSFSITSPSKDNLIMNVGKQLNFSVMILGTKRIFALYTRIK